MRRGLTETSKGWINVSGTFRVYEIVVGADLSRLPLSAPGSGVADLSALLPFVQLPTNNSYTRTFTGSGQNENDMIE
jgi:hypothetical protein